MFLDNSISIDWPTSSYILRTLLTSQAHPRFRQLTFLSGVKGCKLFFIAMLLSIFQEIGLPIQRMHIDCTFVNKLFVMISIQNYFRLHKLGACWLYWFFLEIVDKFNSIYVWSVFQIMCIQSISVLFPIVMYFKEHFLVRTGNP